ncbi:MAG: heparan-alpha-glucosaminide N-acetyltransferase domain-containing protein [Promethearchaeota archaeon]|jgi:uncharacterized membrane protein
MKSVRLKSIDIFRGLCMGWMILNHLIDWWLSPEYDWLYAITIMIIDPIGASGFLFISGVSVALSYRKRLNQAKLSEEYNLRMLRNSYLFRAFFIFIIAIIYNIPVAFVLQNPSMLWFWFVLLTSAVSLLLAWPLLKRSKLLRIFIAIIFLVLHFSIFNWLFSFQGESNIFGLLFHILYNGIFQDPILIFFPFFIIGTVVGDLIYNSIYINQENHHYSSFKNKFLFPVIISGVLMIISGVLINYPQFLRRQRLSWVIYSIGINLILFSIFLSIEIFSRFKTQKSYKLLFYYSYYSLTIYLVHNILYIPLIYFPFLNQLDLVSIWIFVFTSFFSIGFILRGIYHKFEEKASLKAQIGRLSLILTRKIEMKINKRDLKA